MVESTHTIILRLQQGACVCLHCLSVTAAVVGTQQVCDARVYYICIILDSFNVYVGLSAVHSFIILLNSIAFTTVVRVIYLWRFRLYFPSTLISELRVCVDHPKGFSCKGVSGVACDVIRVLALCKMNSQT